MAKHKGKRINYMDEHTSGIEGIKPSLYDLYNGCVDPAWGSNDLNYNEVLKETRKRMAEAYNVEFTVDYMNDYYGNSKYKQDRETFSHHIRYDKTPSSNKWHNFMLKHDISVIYQTREIEYFGKSVYMTIDEIEWYEDKYKMQGRYDQWDGFRNE